MRSDKKNIGDGLVMGASCQLAVICAVIAIMVMPMCVQAQEAEAVVSDTEVAQEEAAVQELPEINPNEIPSVLFTYWEHTAIMEAKSARGSVRPPTEAELAASVPDEEGRPKPPPEERELRLAGIVYVRHGDWTIWLNEKRVTPTAVPPEAIDLEVYKEFIELKWHDDYTNQIFPIRLRPHQRFNLDARIFLP